MDFDALTEIMAMPYGLETLTLVERISGLYKPTSLIVVERVISVALVKFHFSILRRTHNMEKTAVAIDLARTQSAVFDAAGFEKVHVIRYNFPEKGIGGNMDSIINLSMSSGYLIDELIHAFDKNELFTKNTIDVK